MTTNIDVLTLGATVLLVTAGLLIGAGIAQIRKALKLEKLRKAEAAIREVEEA